MGDPATDGMLGHAGKQKPCGAADR
jgi:hypothetical protein